MTTTTKATTTTREDPLTPAQVEAVQQLIAERQATLLAQVQTLIADAVDPLEEFTIKYGDKVALRAASGKLLCANGGGPIVDNSPFEFVARTDPGPWESYQTERGQ